MKTRFSSMPSRGRLATERVKKSRASVPIGCKASPPPFLPSDHSCRSACGGQANRERRADPHLARNRHVAIHGASKLAAYGQAETHPEPLALIDAFDLYKGLEDRCLPFGRYSASSIAY